MSVISKGEAVPTAKRLIMRLLQAEAGRPLASNQLVTACRVFDITENSSRVALARLSAAGMIDSTERGQYKLGIRAMGLAGEVANWRTLEQRIMPWGGNYIVAILGPRSALRASARKHRDRALKLQGMQSLHTNLHIRPDNLTGGALANRQRLLRLGLDADAAVFHASDFDPAMCRRIARLWDHAALNRSYRRQIARLEAWLDKVETLSPEAAARESFLLGNEAIRRLLFDPLLPDDWVDVVARRAWFATVRHFDAVGQSLWQRVYQLDNPEFERRATIAQPLLREDHESN